MRVTSKGPVTTPHHVREKYGIHLVNAIALIGGGDFKAITRTAD